MSGGAMDQLRDRRTLSDLVIAELRERIASGRLPMGAEINQVALTGELGVGRAAVREAFRQLEASGVIRLTPHRHAVVTTLHGDQLDDLLRVRMQIEDLALRRVVASDIRPEHVQRLRQRLAMMRAEERQDAWLALDREFHRQLCELGGNPLLTSMLDSVRLPVERFDRLPPRRTVRVQEHNAEHECIVDALAAGDVNGAQESLRRHLRAVHRRIRAHEAARRRG